MKVLLPFIYLYIAIVVQVLSQNCECPDGQTYIDKTNQCILKTLTPPEPIKGCVSYYYDNYYQKQLCESCKPGYYYKKLQHNVLPTCIQTDLVACILPEIERIRYTESKASRFISKLSKTKFKCLQCMSQYYLDVFQQCQPQPQQQDNNYVNQCKEYKPSYKNEPICNQCEKGYYLIDNKCEANQIDHPNCLDYYWSVSLNTTKCEKCLDNFYLDQNHECQPYPTNDPGCNSYKLNYFTNTPQCKSCKPDQGYAFDNINNKCLIINDEKPFCNNAVVIEGILECYGCEQGYYISINKDLCIKNPTSLDPLYIPNCEKYQYYYEVLECVKCQENYVYEDERKHKCIFLNSPVEHCLRYFVFENTTQCKECEKGYTLNGNLKNNNECNKCPLTDSLY